MLRLEILITASAAALLLVSGCAEEPSTAGDLPTYLLSEEDLTDSEDAQMVTVNSENTSTRATRRWSLAGGVSPLPVSTQVENTIHDTSYPGSIFDSEREGWRHVDSPGIGDRSELLVTGHSGGENCGYKVVVQRGNLVAVVRGEVRCISFPKRSDELRGYVLDLARRQSTIMRGYPSAL